MFDTFFSLLPGLAVRSTLILIVTLAVARLLVRRSAAVRHGVFTAAIVGVLVLPALTIALPAVHAPFVARAVSSSAEWLQRPIRSLRGPTTARAAQQSEPSVVDEIRLDTPETASLVSRGSLILTILWVAGLLIIGGRTALRVTRAGRLTGRARPIHDQSVLALAGAIARRQRVRHVPQILESADLSAPATTGILKSVVLLPATRSWTDEHLRTVLTHEIAHVARRDCLTQHLAQVACALYWFNPLVWIVERRMALERERACDDIAMGQGNSADGYAMLLLDVARHTCEQALPRAAVLAMARPSELEARLMAILDPARDRGVMTGRARRTMGAVAALTVATAGVVRLEAPPVAPNVSVSPPPATTRQARTEPDTRGDPVAALTVATVGTVRVEAAPVEPNADKSPPPRVLQQGRGEPDTRGDSVADPESERIAGTSLELARRSGRIALGGPDSALAHVLLMALERVPRSREDLVRERAAWALTQVQGERLIEPLTTALDDKDWRVRAYAAWALAPARDPRAVPALVRQMSHPVWRMRAMAAHALAETPDVRARSVMTTAIADEAWQVRMNAVRYLAQFSDADAQARVREALRDRHVAVRQAAELAVAP
jgi:beta-lactamase regulating signal transducer with metallopeptidase domain